MKRTTLKWITAGLLLAGPARAAEPTPTDAKRLAECRSLLAVDDSARKNADKLTQSCEDLEKQNADLRARNAELEKLTSKEDGEHHTTLDLALKSKQELEKTVVDLEQKLDLCIEENAVPWYGRWELWVGVAAGLVVGGVAGIAVKSL